MNQINRRQVLPGSAAFAAVPALVLPRAALAAERILNQTNGQVAINVFPNNQLGNDSYDPFFLNPNADTSRFRTPRRHGYRRRHGHRR